jgi:hypothetical protein
MPPIQDLKILLKELGVIRLKYSAQYEEANFNIFSILRKEHDEVHLHSAFIAELLDTKGSHGMSGVFLEHFLKEVKIPLASSLDLRDVKLEVERRFPDYGQIDILIRISSLPKRVVIIENKIYAGDGDAQLERYFNFALGQGYKVENIHILYLTLDGSDPTPQSLGGLKREAVTCISYGQDVIQWLTQCVRDASLRPPLRETILQYSNLIKKLTGNSMNEKNRDEVIELLSQGDNPLLGKTIIDTWVHMKWYTTWQFWEEFEARLSSLATYYPAFKILPIQKYSEDYLNGLFHRERGRDFEFGLLSILCPFRQSHSDAIALNIQTDNVRLYFGLRAVRNESSIDVSGEPAFAALADQLAECSDPDFKNDWWLGGKYFKSKDINLLDFKTEDTVDLVNAQKRRASIEALYAEIVEFLETCRIEETLVRRQSPQP